MIDIERFSESARFVRSAVEAGAHFQPPPLSSTTDWDRNVDIILTYYFGKFEGKDNNRSFPYEKVGKLFPGDEGPLTRERVRQIVTETVGQLYINCPAEVQAQYNLDILKTQIGKPKFMTYEEGATRTIAEDVETGKKYKNLNERYSSGSLFAARTVLAPYGIVVPLPENQEHINFLTERLQKVGPDTDKKILKQLLGEVDLSLMNSHRDLYDKYFVGLTKLLRDLGFHFDMKSGDLSLFLERIEHFNIPFGHIVHMDESGPQKIEQNYYFIFRIQKEEISQSLLPDADLAKFLHNPIVQISGIEINKLPNTTDLTKRKDFRSILTLCRELKIRAGGSGFKMEHFLEGCPFPVFRYTTTGRKGLGRKYRYPVAYQEHLADFLSRTKTTEQSVIIC